MKKTLIAIPSVIIALAILEFRSVLFADNPVVDVADIEREEQKNPQESSLVIQLNDQLRDQQSIFMSDESVSTVMFDSFSEDSTLEEVGVINESANQRWWVNSGAFLFVNNGVGSTIHGELPRRSRWQTDYKKYNASETDGGYHPQNIFRLVTRSTWKNLQQECYYRMDRYILSKAKERSESNGLLLFNRYQDGDNLYYTGIRVDGFSVIKKKIKGQYFTMAYERVFPGKYDRKKKSNLLPLHQWIGLRSEVKDEVDGTVNIKLFLDRNRSGDWKLVAEATDNGKSFGGKVIAEAGHAGIRTDFMDVEFDDYRIEEIE